MSLFTYFILVPWQVISKAGGPEIDNECRRHLSRCYDVKVTKNIVTTAGRLPYKAVIHAVGPRWYQYG